MATAARSAWIQNVAAGGQPEKEALEAQLRGMGLQDAYPRLVRHRVESLDDLALLTKADMLEIGLGPGSRMHPHT